MLFEKGLEINLDINYLIDGAFTWKEESRRSE